RLNQLPTLKAASDADPLYATVLGPMLNSQYSPELMTFDGVEWRESQAVIHVKVWRDDVLRKKNFPFYPFLVVPLQRPALKGKLHVEVDWTFLRAPDWGQLYASGDAPGVPGLGGGQGRPGGKEQKRPVSLWQRTDIKVMQIHDMENRDLAPIGLKVGTFDLKKWQGTTPSRLNQLPTLKAASAADPLYATVLGPMLNSGEFMTFDGVEWRKNQAVIHVKVWRDDCAGEKNLPFYPFLVVPLQRPALKGEFRVEVDWTLLRAPPAGELYPSGHAP